MYQGHPTHKGAFLFFMVMMGEKDESGCVLRDLQGPTQESQLNLQNYLRLLLSPFPVDAWIAV